MLDGPVVGPTPILIDFGEHYARAAWNPLPDDVTDCLHMIARECQPLVKTVMIGLYHYTSAPQADHPGRLSRENISSHGPGDAVSTIS